MTADEMKQRIRDNSAAGKGITLGYIDYNFNSIDTLAFERGDLVYDDDSLLHDGGGNPYLYHRISLPVISSQTLSGDMATFYFDPEMKLDNVDGNVDYIEIAFAANGEKIRINPGEEVQIDISSFTDSIIKTRVSISKNGILLPGTFDIDWFNGKVYTLSAFSSNKCFIDSAIWSGNLPFKGYDEANATQGHGNFRIFRRQIGGNWDNCATDIKKPIIIIDGFDPGDVRQIVSYVNKDGNDEPGIWDLLQYGNNKHLGDELRKKGYDVIVLNFPNYKTIENGADRDGGADYIERNAMVLIKLIDYVNGRLSASGSNEKIVVVGPSMGGQIARFGLAYMEKNGWNHNTRLYLSFDSPHKGANIPLSLQKSIYAMGYTLNKKDAQTSYNSQLRSKAARQLLIEQRDGLNGTATFHTQYYNSRLINNGVSGSNGWPINLKKVALINGTATGQKNGSEGAEIFNVYAGGFIKVINVKAWSMPAYGNSIDPHYRVGGFVNVLTPSASVSEGIYNSNSRGSMDVMPGGTFNTGVVLRDQIKKTADKLNITTYTNKLQFTHCFIPSVSGLAFNNTNFNWASSFSNRNLVCNGEIPFDAYYTAPGNESHVSLTEASAKWAIEEIEKGQAGCAPICKSIVGYNNDLTTPVCINSTRTLYHNYNLPTGVTTTWSVADNPYEVSIVSSTDYSVTVKGLSELDNAVIRYKINNPCGANIEGSFELTIGAPSGNLYLYGINSNTNGAKIMNFKPATNQYYWGWNSSGWMYYNMENYPGTFPTMNYYDPNLPKLCLKTINTCGSYTECIYPYLPAPTPLNARLEIEELTVYPNPTTDEWTVMLSNSAVKELRLYNSMGVLVWSGKPESMFVAIPANNLNAGVYILKVIDGKESKSVKLIKR